MFPIMSDATTLLGEAKGKSISEIYIMNIRKFSIFPTVLLLAACSSVSVDKAAQADAESQVVCRKVSKEEVAKLLDRWNQSLKTGDPAKVVANYAEQSILLPTVSNKIRLTKAEKEDYFRHFMESQPVGTIEYSYIDIGCNTASDAGLYTFTLGKTGKKVRARYSFNYRWDGKNWLISQHHSSVMPEK